MSSDTFVNNNIFETLNTLTGGGIECNSTTSLCNAAGIAKPLDHMNAREVALMAKVLEDTAAVLRRNALCQAQEMVGWFEVAS